MKLQRLFLLYLIFFIITSWFGDASRLMNNKIVKSIQSQDGDVIDCVHINHQPAFDHPLLKDHVIKTVPSYRPGRLVGEKELSNEEDSNDNKNQITQIWQMSGKCPQGTIPIRRTDEKRGNSITKKPRRNGHKKMLPSSVNTDAVNEATHEYGITYAPYNGQYYGTQVTISVWQPFVERNSEFSLSQIWLAAGSDSDLNTIEVGWIVYPDMFGDNLTRLFIFWTTDNYQSGCWNLLCSGFVQIDNTMAIGGAVSRAGNNPEVTLLVWQDVSQEVWWLEYNGSVIIGYWPNSIFTNLDAGFASIVEWGGEIINSNINGVHTTTQMGSGSFPQAGFGKASNFRQLLVVDDANTLIPPTSVSILAPTPNCYNVTAGQNSDWGNYFFYGGPGKNPNCS